jgi:ribonuclease PH
MNPTKREDGRSAAELRPVAIETNFLDRVPAHALVRCGGTVVLCTATIEGRVPPWLSGGGKGWVTAEYSMLPGCSNSRIGRERAKVKGRTHEIERLIGRSLRAVCDLRALGERQITVDCDVLQADGGTRTASITGGYVALARAIDGLIATGELQQSPLTDFVAAISVGIVDGAPLLDLPYSEDVRADVDMNIVMNGAGQFIEVQGTAEGATFDRGELDAMLDLANEGIRQLHQVQRATLLRCAPRLGLD